MYTKDVKQHKGHKGQRENIKTQEGFQRVGQEGHEGPALVLPTLTGVCEGQGEERFCRSQRVPCNCLNPILSNFQQLKIGK